MTDRNRSLSRSIKLVFFPVLAYTFDYNTNLSVNYLIFFLISSITKFCCFRVILGKIGKDNIS